jgi:predicted Zn-dependent peptidase
MISTFTRNACLAEMHEVVTQLLSDMHARGLSEQEVQDARAYLLGMQVRRLETPEALGGAIAETELFDLGLSAITDFRRDVEAVDVAACARAVEACLPGDNLLTVLVGDKAQVSDVAKTLGDLTIVGPDFAEP